MNIIKRKLIKFGNSKAITIPRELLTFNDMQSSKYVYIKLLTRDEVQAYEDFLNDRF